MSKYKKLKKKNFIFGGQDYWGHDCHDGHVYRIWALLGLVLTGPPDIRLCSRPSSKIREKS